MDIYSALSLVQRVKPGMVVETRSLVKIAGSKATLSRALKVLEEYGFVWGRARGWVAFADALWQPAYVIESILPSLRALRGAVPVRCPRKAFELLRDFLSRWIGKPGNSQDTRPPEIFTSTPIV